MRIIDSFGLSKHAPVQEMTASISAILAALSLAAHKLVWKLRILVPIFTPHPHAYQRRHQPGGDCGDALSYDFFSLLPHLFFLPPSFDPNPFLLYKFPPSSHSKPPPLSSIFLSPSLASPSHAALFLSVFFVRSFVIVS